MVSNTETLKEDLSETLLDICHAEEVPETTNNNNCKSAYLLEFLSFYSESSVFRDANFNKEEN